MIIRPAMREDMPFLKAVIEASELFAADMLDDMMEAYFLGNNPDELWFTSSDEYGPHAIAYCAPERMTQGTWNQLLIAVHPVWQGKGVGSSLMRYIESLLAKKGERILLVETSGLPSFERTRAFYAARGYQEEARIRDFYQAGEDKIIFRKALHS